MEIITEIGHYLETIEGIISRQIKNQDKKNTFLNVVKAILLRKSNTILKLAVIGQFSSGKSTFINAILREGILKVKNEASTASATFIKKGEIFKLKVTFYHDYVIEADENHFENLQYHLERFHFGQLDERREFRYFIELLTTNEEITASITNLEIIYPTQNDFLYDTILIDTPGLFAGVEYASTHNSITQSIIDHTADLAIVLIPSHQAMSRSLVDFLSTLPQFLLKRCVFVISEMDRIDNTEDRNELVNFTKKLLKEKLSIIEPILYDCSAISMLPEAKNTHSLRNNIEYWQISFKNLEESLKDMLKKNREIIIEDKLKHLTQNLINEVSDELKIESGKILEKRQIISQSKIESIEKTLNSILEDSKRQINKKGGEIKDILYNTSKYTQLIKASASRKIQYSGASIYREYETIESQLHEEIEEELETIVRAVNIEMNELNFLCEKISKNFEKQFNSNYKTLKYLGKSFKVENIQISDIELPYYNFTSYKYLVETKIEEASSGTKTGAIIGGILGFFVGGPLGAAVGAGLGGATGNSVSKESLETLQPKLKNKLHEEIEKAFQDSISKIKKQVIKVLDGIIEKYKNIVNKHISMYGKDIQILIKQYNDEVLAIEHQIAATDNDHKLLIEILNNLNN